MVRVKLAAMASVVITAFVASALLYWRRRKKHGADETTSALSRVTTMKGRWKQFVAMANWVVPALYIAALIRDLMRHRYSWIVFYLMMLFTGGLNLYNNTERGKRRLAERSAPLHVTPQP